MFSEQTIWKHANNSINTNIQEKYEGSNNNSLYYENSKTTIAYTTRTPKQQ